MQGGGNEAIKELARMAAAAAKTDWAARVAAMRPVAVRKYRGVQRRKSSNSVQQRKNSKRYYSVIWNIHTRRLVWLGSYMTPEEAAYAYDAALRVTRGHRARPNFPAPAPPSPPGEVSTELALAVPRPTAPARRREPAAAVAAQASFDLWLSGSAVAAQPPQHQQGAPAAPSLPHQQQQPVALPPFTQFFHLSGPAPATAAAATAGAAAVANPSNPGAYVSTPQNVRMSSTSTNPASSTLSSTEPRASQFFLSAAAPTQHRELPVSQATASDLAVVGDNISSFTDDGASSSSAPPPVDLLLHIGLPGRRGPGGQ